MRGGRLRGAMRRSSATWIASALVGTTTRAFGAPEGASPSICSSGMPNASVFPVPVLACPIMSCPRSASGRGSAWMGNVVEISLPSIAREGGGLLIYELQEGRGIGLLNKLRAYELQDQGADTIEANQQLGFDSDLRNYQLPGEILQFFGLKAVRRTGGSR